MRDTCNDCCPLFYGTQDVVGSPPLSDGVKFLFVFLGFEGDGHAVCVAENGCMCDVV